MKIIKWKRLIITGIICLLPILLGIYLWDKLPDTMAIHFNIKNKPDNFASKEFVVFGFPFFMFVLQVFCSIISDINSYKHREQKKLETSVKWIIPVIAFILQIVILLYGLGYNLDMRIFAVIIVIYILIIYATQHTKENENEHT